jgi:hypothetical protein
VAAPPKLRLVKGGRLGERLSESKGLPSPRAIGARVRLAAAADTEGFEIPAREIGAWLRLAAVAELNLDFEIPGLRGRV